MGQLYSQWDDVFFMKSVSANKELMDDVCADTWAISTNCLCTRIRGPADQLYHATEGRSSHHILAIQSRSAHLVAIPLL
jgi:hypothetical protein